MQNDERVVEVRDALHRMRVLVEAGEIVEAGSSQALMERIQTIVPMISRADVVLIKTELDEVLSLLADQHAEMAKELKRVQQSRKGLDGYNHIRGHDTEQRLSRTA